MIKLLSMKKSSIPVLFLLTLSIAGCNKNNDSNEQDALEAQYAQVTSESDNEAEIIFNDVFDDVLGVNDEVGVGGTGIFGRPNSCPTVTITRLGAPNLFPVRITMDYGTGGCVGRDGRTRRGKVIAVYTNRLIVPGAMATTGFDGFYVDSTLVEGIHKITNTGSGQLGTPPAFQYTVQVTGGKLTRPSGSFVQWNSNKVITQTEGMATAAPIDDWFKIEGNSVGQVSRLGRTFQFESTITEPLIKKFSCRWLVKGILRTVRTNALNPTGWAAVLNFGTGNCDNLATITINGVVRQITLP